MNLRVGIAGCGIGGMAAALFLSRAGHAVTIFDQFKSPEPIGSGLVIQPVGLEVLQRLGLRQTAQECGHAIYNMYGTESQSGRRVLSVDYGPKDGETFGLGIHRASLFNVLFQALNQENITLIGEQIIKDTTIESSARYLVNDQGERHGPFDVIIDASGASSRLSPIKTRALSYGALWGTVKWPANGQLPQNQLSQSYRRASHMLGVLPLGKMPDGQDEMAAIFWSDKRASLPHWHEGSLDAWKQSAVDLWPEFDPFICQVQSHTDMTTATYSHGTLWKPYADAIAFIGDAAHQASPQLGQGANMALLDADALSTALNSQPNIQAALRAYARRRRWHVQLYQHFSAAFTPFYQSDSRLLPPLRDYALSPLSQIWPLKPMLTRLVCGTLIRP